MKEGAASTKVDSLSERLRVVEKEVAEIRAELARVEAERLPPLTKLASRRAGRPVSEGEMRQRARGRRDEIVARIQQQPSDGKRPARPAGPARVRGGAPRAA